MGHSERHSRSHQKLTSSPHNNHCHVHKSKKKKKGDKEMMANPYICITELDRLRPDDTIIDYAYISEDKFILVMLLASNGDVQVYAEVGNERARTEVINILALCGRVVDPLTICISPEASFVVFGLSDGDLLLVPIKSLLNVSWGSSRWIPGGASMLIALPADLEPVMLTPTCTRCFLSKHPKRPVIVSANKGGKIMLVDMSTRKCVAELNAPQSIHNIDVITHMDNIDLLVTSFTGAQWVIPLEDAERGFMEVLSTCIPAEYKQVSPSSTQLVNSAEGIVALNSEENTLQLFTSLAAVQTIPKKEHKIPPNTWLIHMTDKVLFTVSSQTEMRCAVNFGMQVRLEYTLVRDFPDWRLLGFVALQRIEGRLPACFFINERGLYRLSHDPASSLDSVISEFIYRLPTFSPSTLEAVAAAAGISPKHLEPLLIPSLIANRRGKRLTSADIHKIIHMAAQVGIKMENVVDMFPESEQDQLLPEVLRVVENDKKSPIRFRVVKMFVSKCLAGLKDEKEGEEAKEELRQKLDSDLSMFLSRHADVREGAELCASNQLWKGTAVLAARNPESQSAVLKILLDNGSTLWRNSQQTARSQMLSCIWQLDCARLSPTEGTRLMTLLTEWQRDLPSPALHEESLRLALSCTQQFPQASTVLYLVSALHLLNENMHSCKPDISSNSLGCGLNNAVGTTFDDRLMIWGDLTNQQNAPIEANDIPLKLARRGSSMESSGSPKRTKPFQMPRAVPICGRPHFVAAGTEHVLVLTTAGQLLSWGGNRYGQCGLGHNQRVKEPQSISGEWHGVRYLSAGQFHSALLDEDGQLWTWGWGMYGQLGQGERSIRDHYTPKKVPDMNYDIISVSCGRVHTVVLTKDGQVLVAGGGAYGQLGTNEHIMKQYSFKLVQFESGVKIRLLTTRFYHTLAVSEDDRLFEWGRNPQEVKMKMFVMRRLRSAQQKAGLLETESPMSGTDIPSGSTSTPPSTPSRGTGLPAKVPREDLGMREIQHLLNGFVVDASVGLSHSAVVTDVGSLFTWGKGLEYQLGHGNKNEHSEPRQLYEPADVRWEKVQCGGNHTLAVTEDGRLYGWGRNDFAQCGVPSDKPSATPRKYFYTPKDSKEGAKRCVQLPDDSVYVVKPTMLPDIQIRQPQQSTCNFDSNQLLDTLRSAELPIIQMVSQHFLPTERSQMGDTTQNLRLLSASVPLAIVHLMAGRVIESIDQVAKIKEKKTEHLEVNSSLTQLSTLIWEVIANHEDCQTKQILEAAFRHLPLTNAQRNSSQLKHLWPAVWNSEGTQRDLTTDEKLNMLEGWTPPVRTISSVQIAGEDLRGGNGRIRVWSACSHVEPAALGVVSDCATCVEEWKEKVQATFATE